MAKRIFYFVAITFLFPWEMKVGFAQTGISDNNKLNQTAGKRKTAILALGDSYTIGTGVMEEERWITFLAASLQNRNLNIAEPEIIAQNGWTTADLLVALSNNKPVKKYDLVTLQIGVNNQYQRGSPETYRKELSRILEKAIELTGNRPEHILMLSIPDWGVTPVARQSGRKNIAAEISRFNKVGEAVCKKYGVAFVDISRLSKAASGDPAMVSSDGLHFSGKMYRLWAEKALPVAQKILK